LQKSFRQPLKVDRVLRDAQSFKSERVINRRSESSVINAGRSPSRMSSDEPSPFVDVELHQAFVAHFFIHNIGPFHDLVHFERLLAESVQDIFSIIQHDQTPTVTKRAKSLRIRKLIFRNYSLDVLRLALDAVSKASIGLDGHALDDGVNHWWINCGTTLWTLGLVLNVLIQLIGM
jgi:hypothetical protein